MEPAIVEALVDNRVDFFKYLVRRLSDRDVAEDVLQDFQLRVLRRGSELRNSESAVAWLYRVLRSTLVDHYRSAAVRRRGETSYTDFQSVLFDEANDGMSLEDGACSCCEAVLPELRPEYSEALRRIYFQDTSREEAAADLDITPDNLRVRLHRARKALRQALGSCCGRGFRNCECDRALSRFPAASGDHVPAGQSRIGATPLCSAQGIGQARPSADETPSD